MRRMFSENQIKNIVNQGIQEGEIQVGTKLYVRKYSCADQDQTYYIEFEIVTPLKDIPEEGLEADIENAISIRNAVDKNNSYDLVYLGKYTSGEKLGLDFIYNDGGDVTISNVEIGSNEYSPETRPL